MTDFRFGSFATGASRQRVRSRPLRRRKRKAIQSISDVVTGAKPRESKIAVARAAGQCLRSFQADAARRIGVEIKPANVRQDFLVSMASREFAKAASL